MPERKKLAKLANVPNGPAPLADTAITDQAMIREAIHLMKFASWQSVFHYFQGIKWVKAATIKKILVTRIEKTSNQKTK